jgi:hypothetical protein|uniref:Uncharacterized protein n=1 Tax=viral metagenome TaxID=1070528 RepID=A0A6C0E0G3_9ZZZZ
MANTNDDLYEELDNSQNNISDIDVNKLMKNLKNYKPAELKKMLNSMMGGNKEIQNLVSQMANPEKETDDFKKAYKNKLKAMREARSKR